MSLSRVKVWNPGDVLTASDLNGEFNNVLNNPVSLVSPTTGPINFNLQAHTNLLPSAISASSGSAGNVLAVSGGATVWQAAAAAAGSRVRGLSGTLSSATGTFLADQYLLQTTNAAQSFVMASTATFTVNIGTAGPAANGRDIAGNFASTYVSFYAITTGAGSTTPAGIVSTATPAQGGPILPSGYSGWTYLVSAPYSSVSTTLAFLQYVQSQKVWFDSAQTPLSNGNSTAITAVSLSSNVPPNAGSVLLHVKLASTDQANNNSATIAFTSSGGGHTIRVATAISGQIGTNSETFSVPNRSQSSGNIWYNNSTALSAGFTTLEVMGYDVSNGDA